jgi:pimeloyl-ACP methyl ester carboxylesterase
MNTYTTVEGHQIFYIQEGLPIILIHGVPTGSYQWSPVQQLISPYLTNYNIDIIGMGKSEDLQVVREAINQRNGHYDIARLLCYGEQQLYQDLFTKLH